MTDAVSNVSGELLKQMIAKIERLENEKQEISIDISEVYKEAKSHGFDTKILRKLITIRKLDEQKRLEQEELLDLYKHAVGMV